MRKRIRLQVTAITAGGLCENLGLRVGDRITHVNSVATCGKSKPNLHNLFPEDVSTFDLIVKRGLGRY